ncbi:hypothetical protein C3486_07670 [Streptomyces sp. Ru73]|uniref:hypothetical protein n=1 Tax=Streptomyces sp. Ru73 TaxID=2080748 RepID=UPI000CDE5450|nr:hypothetical protein [Streptomyces sp. Ru73]POX41812.1 hypothetical protein C3486_07670 [Streptomyces sp. Ru73]
MSFDHEWAQLKRGSAAGVRLDSTAAPAAGGQGGLKSSKSAWTKAGEGVGSLQGSIGKALSELEGGRKGLGKDSGCLTAAAQRDVHESWERYVRDVRKRCSALQEVLQKTGDHFYKNDEATKGAFDKLDDQYTDTPGVGGHGKGK